MSQSLESGKTLDKIIAVVGNEIIMQSDIEAQASMLAYRNSQIDPNDKKLREQILDALINEKLIVTKAIEDSIIVTDEEIEQRWQDVLQNLIMRFGSEKRVEDVHGMSITRLKYEVNDEIKKNLLAAKIRQTKFGDVKCSPREVEDFYIKYKDSLEMVPPQIEVAHIVKYISADTKSKDEIMELSRRVRDSIIKGGDFADFAKRYSADHGTAPSGGELGWIERGRIFPELEKSAFSLHQGEVSLPIESPLGFHLLQVTDKRKDAVFLKNILFKIGQSQDDRQNAKNFLLDIKKSVENGENFEELAKKHSEDKDTRGFGGVIGMIQIAQMPQSFRDVLDKLPEGGVSDPIPYSADPNKPAFHILYKKKYIPEHYPTLETDRKEIEQRAVMNKQMLLMQEWLETLRKTMYWEIKK